MINESNFVSQLYFSYSAKSYIYEHTEIDITITKTVLFLEGLPEQKKMEVTLGFLIILQETYQPVLEKVASISRILTVRNMTCVNDSVFT